MTQDPSAQIWQAVVLQPFLRQLERDIDCLLSLQAMRKVPICEQDVDPKGCE